METQAQSLLIKQNKFFQLMESTSQYLTVVRKSVGQQNRNLYQLDDYLNRNTETRIDYENLAQCFVQIAYMIYTAKYYGLNPNINKEDVMIEENVYFGNEKKFSIVIYYQIFEGRRQNNNYSSIIKHIYKHLKDYYENYEKKIKESQIDNDQKNQLSTFMEQLSKIEVKLQELQLNDISKENNFYLFLEETDYFRENSMLLKIKNYSMLDYIKTKIYKFKNYKDRDELLVNQYNLEKNKVKCNLDQLKKKEKIIEKNITGFFEEVEKTNPTKFKLKLQPDQNYKTKFIFTAMETPPQPFLTRLNKTYSSLNSTTSIPETMQAEIIPSQRQLCQPGQAKQKQPKYMEYQIQYNSERNSICVRLIMSSIACSQETIDYIMFQSNVITFQSANISLEFVGSDKGEKNTNVKKCLAFRGASCFNSKEPILEKILILMDLTMITAKMCEPELLSMRKNFLVDKDPHKLSVFYQKLTHYTKVFLRCAKKVYSE